MEKAGRRFLLLGGMLTMVVAAVLITISLNTVHLASWMSYISVIASFLFIIGFAIGLGTAGGLYTLNERGLRSKSGAVKKQYLKVWRFT